MSAITALSMRTVSVLLKRKNYISTNSLEEIASYVEQDGKKVFVFQLTGVDVTKPFLPE